LASDLTVDLDANTTQHLITDIELLRVHLDIERWHVLGFSWGTTLALAYAQSHPDRVTALVLGLVTTTSRREVAWLTEGVGRLFPEQWARFSVTGATGLFSKKTDFSTMRAPWTEFPEFSSTAVTT
jgi:proline iminopeptidase